MTIFKERGFTATLWAVSCVLRQWNYLKAVAAIVISTVISRACEEISVKARIMWPSMIE
jgi:hypothetical protein